MNARLSTFQNLLDDAYHVLQETSPTPKIDAEYLLQHASNQRLAWLISHASDAADPETVKNFYKLLKKRQQGQPIAYLLGSRQFWTLDLLVTPDVLIPRPDTETLVEQALSRLDNKYPLRILDLGTGSGAIALSIAKERSNCQVTATDNSAEALSIAQQNAQRNKINNIRFIESHWFNALKGETFDMIMSNPPYIAEQDEHLKAGDVRFEPISALSSGIDGLEDLTIICNEASQHLSDNGYLLLEHGYDQQQAVQNLLQQNGYQQIETFADLNQLPRVTVGQLL